MLRVLLTGFDAFGGESINPAWEVIKEVVGEEIAGVTLTIRQLPTVFGKASKEVISAIEAEQPDLVIALGQAGGRPDISLERVALNIDDAAIPDNQGNQPRDNPIAPGAPSAYFATLPIREVLENLHQAGIPASISNSAGTYVCNHTMYSILHHIEANQFPIRAGFIHIPYLPEQAIKHRGAPSMSLVEMVRAVRIAIQTCA